jgi:hypothetical protein
MAAGALPRGRQETLMAVTGIGIPLGEFTRDISAPVEEVEIRPRAIVCRVGSNELDRYLTVVQPSGIDYAAFNRSGGIVLWQHGKEARGSLPVGKSTVRYRPPPDDDLVGRVVFRDDAFSRELFALYADSSLTGWSLRALPHPQHCGPPSYEEIRQRPDLQRCNTIYRSAEMVELSAVAIPGCRSAVTLMIERGLLALPEAKRWLTTGNLPDRPASPPARAPEQPDGGLRLEYRVDTGQWRILTRGDEVSSVYRDAPGELERAARMLRTLALSGAFARAAPPSYARPCIVYDVGRSAFLVHWPGGRTQGFSDWSQDALASAGRFCKSASLGGLG